jgi:8-oxo-dGTP pyrophosphatase MutT (NUDIX family)
MRIRCAGLIKMGDGYAFMHRMNVKPTVGTNKPYGEYYVFPGGGLEENETFEECAKREILEELGIEVKVIKRLYEKNTDNQLIQYVYLCEYVSGTFGTGTGPEFSGDPKYANRGDYIPTIVKKEDIENIRLVPEEFKNKLVEDIKNNNL